MAEKLLRRVALLTAAQDHWLAEYQQREGLVNRAEALRDVLRRAMANEALFVDGNRADGHTEKAREGTAAR